MGRKRMPGLALRGGAGTSTNESYGRRICQSTGTSSLDEAERYLAKVMEDARQAEIYSVRPSRTFEQAAAKFVLENRHKRSINCDIGRLRGLMPWIGDIELHKIHMGVLQPWIATVAELG